MGNNNTVPANNKPTTVFTYPDFYNQVNEVTTALMLPAIIDHHKVELLPAIIHHQDQDNELTNKKELYAVAKAKAQRNQSKSMLFRDYNIRSELKLIKLLIHVNKLLRECTIYAIDHMLIFRHTSSKSVPVLSMSMKELVSLLRSIRSGWGPPLELVTRMLNSKFWVMEADVWADLLIVCCWANPTTIYCEKCSKDVESTTTSCNHVVCPVCVVGKGIGPISCPECGQRLTALLFTSALTSTPEKITSRFLRHLSVVLCTSGYTNFFLSTQGSVVFASQQQLPLRKHVQAKHVQAQVSSILQPDNITLHTYY